VIRVVCQVKADAAQVTFTWSDGTGEFSPYAFKGSYLTKLQECSRACREGLTRMVQDYLEHVNARDDGNRHKYEAALRQSCLQLAQAGHELHKRLFKPEDAGVATKVQQWLKKLQRRREPGGGNRRQPEHSLERDL
jgi:hypothetical protein